MIKISSHLLIIIFLLILLGKFFLIPTSIFFYLYGIIITFVLVTMFYFALFVYKDPLFNNTKKRNLPFVSCMVAVHNEEMVIDKCLLSLLNQTYKKYEVIVVNDSSTDKTKQILDQYIDDPKIKIINLRKNVGKKKALAKAILAAKGTIFFFTDSDSLVESEAVEKVVRIFNSDSEIGAISGHCRALNAQQTLWTKIQDSWYEGQFSIRKAFESVFDSVTCVSGPLAAFRKSAVFNYIPAWEHDQFLGQEFKFATDRTMTGFVLGSAFVGKELKNKYKRSIFVKSIDYPEKEWKTVYSKGIKAWTTVPETFAKIINQQIRWKKSFIRNTFFTGSFFWQKRFLPATFYYLHILFVIVGPFIVLRNLIVLPLFGYWNDAILYLSGIIFVGFAFGVAYKMENPKCNRWMFRPLMSLLSTLVLSWLIFFSALTIRKSVWSRG